MTDQEILDKAKSMADEFVAQLGLDAEVSVSFVEDDKTEASDLKYVFVKFDGEHLSELIGFHGKVFDAIQNILGLMLSREIQQPNIRTLIEINDYRSKREEYLKKYAQRAAEEVRMTGQPLELSPMKPFERRIVHMVLKNDPEVATESYGEGEERRLRIMPKI